MIEAGIEDRALVGCAAFNRDLVKSVLHMLRAVERTWSKSQPGNFLVQVGSSAGFADKGNSHLEFDLVLAAKVEPCSCVVAGCLPLIFLDDIVLPGCEFAEWLFEPGCKVERVAGVRSAEAAGGGGAADNVVSDEP